MFENENKKQSVIQWFVLIFSILILSIANFFWMFL